MSKKNISKEEITKIVGAAFENMSSIDMAKIQGAGDVEGETVSAVLASSGACASITGAIVSAISGIFTYDND